MKSIVTPQGDSEAIASTNKKGPDGAGPVGWFHRSGFARDSNRASCFDATLASY
jgi:hypothetical protein